MSMQDAIDFMMVESGLNLSLKDAVYCYGMSKMTVIKENGQPPGDKNLCYVT